MYKFIGRTVAGQVYIEGGSRGKVLSPTNIDWRDLGVQALFIEPGSPWENG